MSDVPPFEGRMPCGSVSQRERACGGEGVRDRASVGPVADHDVQLVGVPLEFELGGYAPAVEALEIPTFELLRDQCFLARQIGRPDPPRQPITTTAAPSAGIR